MQTVGQHEIFTLPSGETAHFPLDDSLSASECINCRCIIIFVVRSSRQSENYKNLVAKNEDITYTRMYQEGQAENANRFSSSKDVAAINSPIEAHPREISSAFSSKELSTKQKNILDKLPDYGSSATFNKRDVSMLDLAALTAETGDEFAMFTRKGGRLIFRGDTNGVPIRPHELNKLSNQGYRWSGHTHPGNTPDRLIASDGDLEALKHFRQDRSAVYNSYGACAVYDKDGKYRIIERR